MFSPRNNERKISSTGMIEAYLKDQVEPNNLGAIPVFTFNNPPGLKNDWGQPL